MPEKLHNEVLAMLNQGEFVTATIQQINKDLQGLFDEGITLEDHGKSTVIDQLIAILQPALQSLSKSQPEKLSQFIYRVDLGENNYHESLLAYPDLGHLAGLVIQREALKVYLRSKLS